MSGSRQGGCTVVDPDLFSAASIARLVDDARVRVEFFDALDSTNTRAMQLAEQGAPEGTLVVADRQTRGKGRQGRSFVSPAGTGAYFSLILRPRFALEDVSLVTSYAACCVADAIEACAPCTARIKWVNDVFVDGRKVCGILSEASLDAETRDVAHVVVGMGVNVLRPEGGFLDADDVAGALVESASSPDLLRSRVVAATVNAFMRDYERIPRKPHLAAYRERSLLDGRRVRAFSGAEEFDALVLGVDDDLTLRVRLDDGSERSLASGEVRIPSSQLRD